MGTASDTAGARIDDADGAVATKLDLDDATRVVGGRPSSTFWMMETRSVNGTTTEVFLAPAGVTLLHDSQVSVSMTELDPQGLPKLGAASMQVLNVVPMSGAGTSPGQVVVKFNVGWERPIPVRFNFIIVN